MIVGVWFLLGTLVCVYIPQAFPHFILVSVLGIPFLLRWLRSAR